MHYKTENRSLIGYLLTAFCVLVWGCTFIATKVLLTDFSPIETLFVRFLTAYIGLWILVPRRLKLNQDDKTSLRQELYFAAAGLCGVTVYQLLENIALTHTQASNVSIIVSTTPVFTALAMYLAFKNTKKAQPLSLRFILGFFASISGISLISFSGASQLKLNPLGDFLALSAAAMWAAYSVLITKINDFQLPVLETTRRIFFYAILFMIPPAIIMGADLSPAVNMLRFSKPANILNFLFLGIGASALTFSAWTSAGKYLGIVKASTYLYLVPIVTISAAAIILHERFTPMSIIGILLTIMGLFISKP